MSIQQLRQSLQYTRTSLARYWIQDALQPLAYFELKHCIDPERRKVEKEITIRFESKVKDKDEAVDDNKEVVVGVLAVCSDDPVSTTYRRANDVVDEFSGISRCFIYADYGNSASFKWTTTQENILINPLQGHDPVEPALFVQRTFLHRFLWLPHTIPTFFTRSSSPPLVVLSLRTAPNKYHNELRQILTDGGGAVEAEESIMWCGYTLGYEKTDASAERSETLKREDAAMLEDEWRSGWLECMEQREVQIQILLYFLKLFPPVMCTQLPPVELAEEEKPNLITPSSVERLESLMDTSRARGTRHKNEHDWIAETAKRIIGRTDSQFQPQSSQSHAVRAITLVVAAPVKRFLHAKSNASAWSSSPIPIARSSTSRPAKRSSSVVHIAGRSSNPCLTGRSSSPPTARSSSLTPLDIDDEDLPPTSVPFSHNSSDSPGDAMDEDAEEDEEICCQGLRLMCCCSARAGGVQVLRNESHQLYRIRLSGST
ncbi:uncharacterized protein EDB91DRAFT_1083738 [Suillus paluster]|uniref:uncharacterized protein n=1 Tax=Suillus paluster TaxID=48578 RepID=UPI001B8664D2|nr:uncharacterized protein EDB91DRAFT_1083738 [Suillus paluster]KAG1735282.1 hypothetical protein EDB91DRAFT_1083738 [Suillus paluster]